jgi:mannose/fructose/N-acetylgalactosamine-specific phosphotransferase system component IID
MNRWDLLRSGARSFFIQTGFTYERLIALGFVWSLIPVARKLASSTDKLAEILKRHLSCFNANPYLAGYALGTVAELEERNASGEQIARFKDALRGPLGALGDTLMWQNIRPALLMLGVGLAAGLGVYGALAVWLVFNLYQAYLRVRGILKGYALGWEVSSDLGRAHLRLALKWSGKLGAVLTGALLVLAVGAGGDLARMGQFKPQPQAAGLLVLFAALSALSFRRNVDSRYSLLGLIVLSLLVKWFLGMG